MILADDGSTDSCPQICDDYAASDSRVKVIHKKNSGQSDARNAALDIAEGDYLFFLDSDDYIREDAFQILFDRVISDCSDMASCNFLYFNGDNFDYEKNNRGIKDEVIDKETAFENLHIYENDFQERFNIAAAKFCKKSLFDNLRFPSGKIHEDVFVSYKLFDRCGKISCVSQPLYYYRQNQKSTVHTYNIKRLAAAEGYIERSDFFFENKNYPLSWSSLDFALSHIA